MTRIQLALTLLILTNVGCTSHKAFVQARNYDIGKSVNTVHASPNPKIEIIDDQTNRYIFEYKDTGCRWSNIVDNKSKQILSWEYASNPKLCFMTTDYFGPW